MKILVVVPSYPNKNRVDYQFVHERVKEYIKNPKIQVTVFCLNDSGEKKYIYEKIKVLIGNEKDLKNIVDKFDRFIFHFFTNRSGEFILKNLDKKQNYVWFHGSDAVHWRRRIASIDILKLQDLLNPLKIIKLMLLIKINITRNRLIKKINKNCINTHFVFVSNWLFSTSQKDFNIKYENYAIIPNYINLEKFKFDTKTPEKRYKVLVVNNFANSIYGGDLIRNIIISLSKNNVFNKFEFNIFGEGKQWELSTVGLEEFANIKLHKGYLSHADIKKQHIKNGIFLYPKRGDSQGVSRCEAMSSGLVSIASDVDAIPEFSPSSTTYLADDITDFINYFEFIDKNPDDFIKKSKEGSNYIKNKCSYENTIEKEIELIRGEIK